MQTYRRCAAASVLALSALAAPSIADPEAEWTGFSCGFASSNDPTGLVNQDPNVQMGELDCGPVVAAELLEDDLSGPSCCPELADIELHGWIQVNNSSPYHDGAPPSAHCDGSGTGVAYVACLITFTAAATDNVYICAHYYMRVRGFHKYWQWDEDDNGANGVQCSLAISAGG